MKIYEALDLRLNEKNIISFVGGGGKSTSMDSLAKELKSIGKKVLVTTTTMLFYHEHSECDEFVLGSLPNIYNPLEASITLLGSSTVENQLGTKIRGLNLEEIEEISNRDIFDIILIEADGARLKPIKAPGDHEPVVAKNSTMTIGVIGLDSIGKELKEENVHRPEILASLLEVEQPHIIDEDDIVRLVLHDKGLFKGSYGRKVLFLNKADREELLNIGNGIREVLLEKGFKDVFITNIKTSRID